MSVIEDGVSYNIYPHKFIYEGSVKGDPKSIVYGSLFDGIFDGQIFLSDGNSFTVEKSTKYYASHERPDWYHSVTIK